MPLVPFELEAYAVAHGTMGIASNGSSPSPPRSAACISRQTSPSTSSALVISSRRRSASQSKPAALSCQAQPRPTCGKRPPPLPPLPKTQRATSLSPPLPLAPPQPWGAQLGAAAPWLVIRVGNHLPRQRRWQVEGLPCIQYIPASTQVSEYKIMLRHFTPRYPDLRCSMHA